MPTVQKVTILTDRTCDKCNKTIEAGNKAIKKYRKLLPNLYYHEGCYKPNKVKAAA